MSRRTLFLHVTPTLPVASTPATWDPLYLGAGATLSGGNLTVSTTAAAGGTPTTRTTAFARGGVIYWETLVSYTSNGDFWAGIGAGLSGATANPIGEGAGTAGPASGGVKKSGAFRWNVTTTANLGAIASGDTLRHWLDMDARVYKIAVNGGAFVTVLSGAQWVQDVTGAVPVDFSRLYAEVTLQRATGSTSSVTANFGATPWTYGLPAAAGVTIMGSANAATPVPLKLASRSVVPIRAGTNPDQFAFYDGRISTKSDPQLSIQASTWPQGGGASGGNPVVGAIEFWNGDHALDVWSGYIWRDVLAELYYTEGELIDDAETRGTWARAKVDRIEFKADTVRLVFADVLAQLDRPAQTNTYGTQADAGDKIERTIDLVGTQNEGRSLPICIGAVFQADPFNVNPAPGTREYQWSDEPVSEITAVYDKCDPYDELLTGVDFHRTSQTDGFRMSPVVSGPIGKVTADLIGPGKRGTNRISSTGIGAFTTFSGSPVTPSGWTRTGSETAGTTFTNGGGSLRIKSDGTSLTLGLIATGVAITQGAYIEAQFSVVAATTPGPFYLRLVAGLNTVTRRIDVYGPGLYRVTMKAPAAGGTASFRIFAANQAADIADVSIDLLDVWEITPKTGLADILTDLATVRGPLTTADINTASVAALTAKFNPRLGFYSGEQMNTLELARQLLNSVTGFIYADQTMKLAVGRLEDVSPYAATLAIAEADIIGTVTRDFDPAKALSTNLAGRRNVSPTDPSSMASSVTTADKQRWSAAWQYVRSALNRVASAYSNADKAEAFGTWLVDEEDIHAEVNRLATLYSVQRYFYRVTISLDTATAAGLNPGDVIALTANRYDLAAGRNLLCLGVIRRFFSSAVDLILWG